MKMQKLDSKQVPQVIALGVLSVGVFGYAVFTFSGSAPKPSAPAKKETASTGSSTATGATTTSLTSAQDTKMALSVAEAGGVDPKTGEPGTPGTAEMGLPGQYNPDPFKSGKVAAPEKQVEVTPKPAAPKPKVERNAPPLPDARQFPPLSPTTLAPPPVPAGPERPEVLVTGTSVVDGMNLAILEVGQEHRVVQVGDVVSKGYRVKKIQLQGVVFGKEQDRFFRGVGAKSEAEKPDNSLGKVNQF